MYHYKEKKILIVGLGLTGVSCVEYFLMKNIFPRVMDTRLNPPGIKYISKKVQCHLGSINKNWITNADLIIPSPGIQLSLYYNCNQKKIISDIELFCTEAKKPIIAITGSNGKSTVTTLIAKIAEEAGFRVGLGGNIGIPVLNLLKDKKINLYILELSSFQLENTYSLKKHVGIMLNITENHMDRYPLGFKQYLHAKLNIYQNAKISIINTDDMKYLPLKILNKNCIFFGTKSNSTYRLLKKNEKYWLSVKNKKILNCSKMNLIGRHNYINALSTLALADSINIPRFFSLKILTTFSGLPHRFELIYKNKGVSWINDSKSTNTMSTKVALEILKEVKGTLWLLLGGIGKNANFDFLKPSLQVNNIKIYCFGTDAYKLYKLRPSVSKIMKNIQESVIEISKKIQYGDVVLLSPACASHDQFKNFEERGNIFSMLAKKFG